MRLNVHVSMSVDIGLGSCNLTSFEHKNTNYSGFKYRATLLGKHFPALQVCRNVDLQKMQRSGTTKQKDLLCL